MKLLKISLVVSFIFVLINENAYAQTPYPEGFEDALRDGAKAKITVHVVDERGNAVPDANVRAFFEMTFGRSPGNEKLGKTDKDGRFSAEARTTDRIFFNVTKNGYYRSIGQYRAQSRTPGRLKDERWLPWNPTIKVVLKPIINPVNMEHIYDPLRIPESVDSLGFDIKKHDWVEPYGRGSVTDMVVNVKYLIESPHTRHFFVDFPGPMNGAYMCKKDDFSVLKLSYHASTNDVYETHLDTNNGIGDQANILLREQDYLVFRIRSKVNEKGELVSALYGKVYGPCELSRFEMRFSAFLNPVENDTNLEFDGKGFGDGTLFGR